MGKPSRRLRCFELPQRWLACWLVLNNISTKPH
jgi:hypothetical protein